MSAAIDVKVILGCMNFGKRTPEGEARSIVDLALERGVRRFDTANAYGDGVSETILGRALGARRAGVEVATKVGWWRREGLGGDRVCASLDESLARLGMDHVDLYYLHVPDHATPIEDTLAGVGDVLASGKAKAFGISNYASWQALELLMACDQMGVARPVVAQQLYNVLIRQLDLEYFHFAQRYALPTVVYNPLAGGLLAGRHARGAEPVAGSRFDNNALYQRRYLSEVFFDAVDALADVAKDAGVTLVTLAYAWLARHADVSAILVGPGSVAHLADALDAVSVVLPDGVVARVDYIHRQLVGTDASYAR